jgi:hypothetical protein
MFILKVLALWFLLSILFVVFVWPFIYFEDKDGKPY